MTRFVTKTIGFIMLMALICGVIKLFVPYHWGNVWYSTKIINLEKSNQAYNTFFWGSSRVSVQIDPAVFDSVARSANGATVRSYNLGAPATFCPQSYYLFEKFLDDSALSHATRFAFIELMGIDPIGEDLLHQERTNYWQNLKSISFVAKALKSDPDRTKKEKFTIYWKYGVSWLENVFCMGQFHDELMEKEYYSEQFLGKNRNGFFPLEEEVAITTNATVKERRLKSHQEMLASNDLAKRSAASIKLLSNKNFMANTVHLKKIRELIDLASRRGIRLFWILSPRNVTQETAALYHALPASNRINLANAAEHPEFYLKQNSFDNGHLNSKASKEYTILLAEEFKKLMAKH